MRRRRPSSSCFRRARLGEEEVIAEYRPSRWMLMPIAVCPAIPVAVQVVFPRDGNPRWAPILIYVPIVALLWTSCLRGRLSLTRDALSWRVFRSECLARANLRYANLGAYGSVELVAVSGETRGVLGPMGYRTGGAEDLDYTRPLYAHRWCLISHGSTAHQGTA